MKARAKKLGLAGYRAVKAIKLGPDRQYAAGDDLPLPTSALERAAYERLLSEGAIVRTLDGKTEIITRVPRPGTGLGALIVRESA
jgi:hypothetical protein